MALAVKVGLGVGVGVAAIGMVWEGKRGMDLLCAGGALAMGSIGLMECCDLRERVMQVGVLSLREWGACLLQIGGCGVASAVFTWVGVKRVGLVGREKQQDKAYVCFGVGIGAHAMGKALQNGMRREIVATTMVAVLGLLGQAIWGDRHREKCARMFNAGIAAEVGVVCWDRVRAAWLESSLRGRVCMWAVAGSLGVASASLLYCAVCKDWEMKEKKTKRIVVWGLVTGGAGLVAAGFLTGRGGVRC